jgi:hypothetical protein
MATVLEEQSTKEQHSVLHFLLWSKGLNVKDINKHFSSLHWKMFVMKSGSTLVAIVSLMKKRLKWRCGSGRDDSQKTSMLLVSTHW